MRDPDPPAVILDTIDVGVVVRDGSGRAIYANATACRLLGVEKSELLGGDVATSRWRAVTPDGSPLPLDDLPFRISLRTGQAVRDAVIGCHAGGGGVHWLQVTSVPARGPDGRVEAVYTTFTDVSQRQIERNRLSTLYESTVRSVAEGVVINGPDGHIVSANPAAEHILGMPLSEMQGRHPVNLPLRLLRADGTPMPPEEIPSERTAATGVPCRGVKLIIQRSNGERAWLSVSTQPLEGPDGARLGVVSTFVDVTPQETAARELEEQRALLRRVTDAVPGVLYEHVVRVDNTDAFRYVSARAAEVLGLDATAMCESAAIFWARVHPDDKPRVQGAIMAEARARRADEAGGRPDDHRFDEEFRIADAEGRWHWVRAQSLGRAVEGELVCHGVITDTTERHQLAEQLRAAQRQELTGVLVAGIAHNFNNMLAAIVPNLDRARQRVTGELQHELSDAYEASASAAELVRHLMLLVRRDELRTAEPVDVVSLVQDVVRMCRRTFDQRIVIECAVPDAPRLVMGRRSELQQVVLNLCINARDAVERAASPRIDVEVAPLGGDMVGLTVRDNGVGMSAEAKRRAGQAFFTTKAPDKGTGLGLATALGIVREMNGELTWTSAPGQGTVFRLVLPLAAESALARHQERAVPARFDGQVVLVIDDEPLVRNTLSRLLEAVGLTPLLAATGTEGLAMLASRADVRVALVDLSMPEMSGAEVLRRITEQRPGLPVFVVSGWVADPEALTGARGVIQKPFTVRDLTEALSAVLRP